MTTTAAQPARDRSFVRRDDLVISHLSLVHAIANRLRESLPVHVDVHDLTHAGVIGLFNAATKFNEEKHVSFGAYAKHRIRGAILDSLRDLDCASRDLRRRQKQIEQATEELSAKLQRHPTESELAEAVGLCPVRWRQLMIELHNLKALATQTNKQENDKQTPLEPPCARELHPDRMFAKAQIRARLREAMATLPARYQQVVSLYYEGDLNMKEIASLLGVRESRISQIHKVALSRMQNVLQSAGIQSAAAY